MSLWDKPCSYLHSLVLSHIFGILGNSATRWPLNQETGYKWPFQVNTGGSPRLVNNSYYLGGEIPSAL
ncbi:hypothetical protein, partial [Okeania sp. SIO2C9]|uniref:hypothetical protein n=1 Tax=Okeania sp. SIO2C9 TaxID=2607791 RepID=UPI0025F26A3C